MKTVDETKGKVKNSVSFNKVTKIKVVPTRPLPLTSYNLHDEQSTKHPSVNSKTNEPTKNSDFTLKVGTIPLLQSFRREGRGRFFDLLTSYNRFSW